MEKNKYIVNKYNSFLFMECVYVRVWVSAYAGILFHWVNSPRKRFPWIDSTPSNLNSNNHIRFIFDKLHPTIQ